MAENTQWFGPGMGQTVSQVRPRFGDTSYGDEYSWKKRNMKMAAAIPLLGLPAVLAMRGGVRKARASVEKETQRRIQYALQNNDEMALAALLANPYVNNRQADVLQNRFQARFNQPPSREENLGIIYARNPELFANMIAAAGHLKGANRSPTADEQNLALFNAGRVQQGLPEVTLEEYLAIVNRDTLEQSTLPTGYKWVYNEKGEIVGQEPILGGPVHREIEAERARQEKETRAAQEQEKVAARTLVMSMQAPFQAAQEALRRLLNPSNTFENFFEVGPASVLSSNIGGPAFDLAQLLETVKADAFFSSLEMLKAQSATGASGLGQVSKPEQAALTARWGSLEQRQSREQLIGNLRAILTNMESLRRQAEKAYGGKIDWPEPYQLESERAGAPAASPTTPRDVVSEALEYLGQL